MTALAHPLSWQAPRPLWRGTTPFAAAPQILRFATDDFMDQIIATLTHDPSRISERIAKAETWRTPAAQTAAADMVQRVALPSLFTEARRKRLAKRLPDPPQAPDPNAPLKLYQPAHQRYYLIAGSLVCAIPGLPERAVSGGHETVHYVIRRLLPASAGSTGDQTLVEFAYVKGGDEAQWQRVASGADLAPGEELLPLFPLAHRDENGLARTIWSGLIPVARREDYLGKTVSRTAVALADGQAAALRPPAPAAPGPTTVARTAQLRVEVSEPWKAIVRAATNAAKQLNTPILGGADPEPPDKTNTRILDYNLQFQMQSWLLLLDLYDWIQQHLKPLSQAIDSGAPSGLSAGETAVWTWLGATTADTLASAMRNPPGADTTKTIKPMATSLRDALRRIPAFRAKLDAATIQYNSKTATRADWPDFHFPLAGVTLLPIAVGGPYKNAAGLAAAGTAVDPNPAITEPAPFQADPDDAETLDLFTALLARALPASDESDVQPVPFALKLRDLAVSTAGDTGLFVIRMVHMNADCGPLHPPVLSAPSVQFRLASFFDHEAPVRPITITMPTDTSPAGLRKHGRGAAFVLSDMLCGQVQRAKGLGFIDLVLQVLPWPLHKDIDVGDGGGCKGGGLEIGMICSLSIPIITLCALILLIIIVTLLDFIFRWLPWLIVCFPVPKLRGKAA